METCQQIPNSDLLKDFPSVIQGKILRKIAVQESTKKSYADNYEVFLNYLGGVWEKPKYQITQKTPSSH